MKKGLMKILMIFILVVSISACGSNTNKSVAETRLNIETYYAGKNQPTHPSVISFKNEWHGYKFWMAYSPYPEADGEEENPCIAVSNDLFKWTTPKHLANPIGDNEETGCDELKDPHILYRDDLDRIEVWYLGRLSKNLGGDGKSLLLFRKYSYDGVNWSKYEVMKSMKHLSPAVIWSDNKYKMWAIGYDLYNTTGQFAYQESSDGKNWSETEICSIDGKDSDLKLWHGSVDYDIDTKQYRFVYIPDSGNSQDVRYCISNDGIHFKNDKSAVQNSKNSLWARFYRPCLLKYNDVNYLFYGVITEDNKWYISMSKGKSLDNLKGITEEDQKKMVNLADTVVNTKNVKYKIKAIYHAVCEHIRPEIAIVVFIIYCLYLKLCNRRVSKMVELAIVVLLCGGLTFVLFRYLDFVNVLSILLASILEGVSVFGIGNSIFDQRS